MRRTSQAIAAAVALCAAGPASAGDLELDRVVAVVNNDVILASELDRRVVQATVTKNAADPRKAMLWAMIDELLMVQLAVATGLDASEADIDRAVEEVRRNASISEETLLEELKKQGYSLADYRRSVRHQLLTFKVMNAMLRPNITISDAKARALFDQRVKAAAGKPVPTFEDVKEELRKELYMRELDVARDRMLVNLRAQAFIDIRLPKAPAPPPAKPEPASPQPPASSTPEGSP